MPWLDGTGPNGFGPLTGRGFGYCSPRGFARGFGGRGFGRGYGRGFGRGFGRGMPLAFREPTQPTRDEYTQDLRGYVDELKAELKAVEEELADLKKSKTK
jgi:hypothetical protein